MASKLIIVGGGRMGSALAEGLLNAGWCAPEELALVDSAAETRGVLAVRFPGVSVLASAELADVGDATGAVLCVKPDHAESVARVIGATGVKRLLSVVAGLSTARLEAVFSRPPSPWCAQCPIRLSSSVKGRAPSPVART